ncbi:MAG TPA: hypothetical protein VF588_03460 [Pyrinomonadaceae bacterium]
MILQGFQPAAGVAKKPLSGYNMPYFLNAFFRTGKYRLDSQILAPAGGFLRRRARSFGCHLKGGKALGGPRHGIPFGRPRRGKLYRKGLLDGNF